MIKYLEVSRILLGFKWFYLCCFVLKCNVLMTFLRQENINLSHLQLLKQNIACLFPVSLIKSGTHIVTSKALGWPMFLAAYYFSPEFPPKFSFSQWMDFLIALILARFPSVTQDCFEHSAKHIVGTP